MHVWRCWWPGNTKLSDGMATLKDGSWQMIAHQIVERCLKSKNCGCQQKRTARKKKEKKRKEKKMSKRVRGIEGEEQMMA